jgi:hypothetical protein
MALLSLIGPPPPPPPQVGLGCLSAAAAPADGFELLHITFVLRVH